MAQYIPKEPLVAEINRLYGEHSSKYECDEAAIVLDYLEDFIDTLEVKEVDLDKSLTGFMGRYAYENGGEYPSAIDIAKHFFELGIKAQKGE